MGDHEVVGNGLAGVAGGPIDTVDVDFDDYMLGIDVVHRVHGRHRAIVPRLRRAAINQQAQHEQGATLHTISGVGESQDTEYPVTCAQEPQRGSNSSFQSLEDDTPVASTQQVPQTPPAARSLQQREKRGTCKWSDQDLEKAMNTVTDDGMKLRVALRTLGIPVSSLRDHLYGKTRSRKRGKSPTLKADEE